MNKLYHTCKPSCRFKMDVLRRGELYWPFLCYIILPKKKSFVYEGIGKLFERVLIIAHFVYMISPTKRNQQYLQQKELRPCKCVCIIFSLDFHQCPLLKICSHVVAFLFQFYRIG